MNDLSKGEESDGGSKIDWDHDTRGKFDQLIDKIPVFLRSTAKEKVSKRAETIAREDNRCEIDEKDMVDAFFIETPFGFHGPLKTDMEAIQIDYTKYGHPK